ncbi:exodeoxyribonuclease VII, small subunit [gamma proteobacterium HTCC5015]|nr:exodeoxyribonuclease VII, small subunit [gamma proteobacterium HTCC5015]
MATQKNTPFEERLGALEKLVEQLEGGELPLEDALKHFEKGVKLARECETALNKAEQTVDALSQDSDEPRPLAQANSEEES